MKLEPLTDENFVLFAAKYYDNPQCHDTDEFYDDLNRFKYLKRLFGKYEDTGDLRERLILNHIIVLYNVFGEQATRMLFLKLSQYDQYLKPFIVLLGYMPDKIINIGINDETIYSSNIVMNQHIVDILRKI
jgi:hypothetical protein